jgi:hypothetical protein
MKRSLEHKTCNAAHVRELLTRRQIKIKVTNEYFIISTNNEVRLRRLCLHSKGQNISQKSSKKFKIERDENIHFPVVEENSVQIVVLIVEY